MKIQSGPPGAKTLVEWTQDQAYDANDQRSAEEAAEEVGCTVEYADAETIQLDIDSQSDFDLLPERLDRLVQAMPEMSVAYRTYLVRPSKSGNWHVTFKLAVPVTIEKRILIQALLGSDLTREALNLTRHLYGAENPIRLFRPKEAR